MTSAIKLIACDIDGTLLHGNERKVCPEVFTQIKRLYRKGIIFCPASGRQYTSLRKLFAPVANRIYYICENGAVIYGPGEHGRIISKTAMPRENAENLIRYIVKQDYTEVLISGANTSYVIPKSREYPIRMHNTVGNNVAIIKDPSEIEEDIIKISACCEKGVEYFFNSFNGDYCSFEPVVSGLTWIDFTLSDKGTGIRAISEKESIPLKNIMAIGDNYNDVPMFDIVGHPYIMENAVDELKKQYKNHCVRVEKTLKEL